MEVNSTPRIVHIVTDGPLMAGVPARLAGRPAIHIPVASPPLRSAAIAITVATGVSPLVHGIVTKNTVDCETLQVREAVRSDRRFQTFWDGTDLDVKLINWPATSGDPRATNYQSQHEFDQAVKCLDADVLGILLPRAGRERSTPSQVQSTQQELETFLSMLSPKTHIVIVHRRTKEDGSKLETLRVFGATFLVNDCEYETNKIPLLELIGGASYLLVGVPCPAGVKQPQWSFLSKFEMNTQRPFPLNSTSDEVDWLEVIQGLVESENDAGITLLTQRCITLVSVAFKKEIWEEIEYNSECLIQLQGKPFGFWMLILALEQQGKIEELQLAIERLQKIFPEIKLTTIANCLLQLNPIELKEKLQSIDITEVGVYHAIGLYGRLCLRAGLGERGREAITLALHRGVATSSDRAQLANYYFEKKQFEEALKVLRSVGLNRGEFTWQALRLNILVALNRTEEIVYQAHQVLNQNPAHEIALKALETYR